MCKFGTYFSKIGLGAFLLSILTMVLGWLVLNINVCIAAMFLMSLAALSFTLCMVCNCASEKRKTKLEHVNEIHT
jgi:hypothetical protein